MRKFTVSKANSHKVSCVEQIPSAPKESRDRPGARQQREYWAVKKEMLREKYGIDWRSPAERYPHIIFD